MITTGVFDFRNNLAMYLKEVEEDGTKIVVRRFGKPVGMLVPYGENLVTDYRKFFGFLKGDENGEAFLKRVRRNKRELDRVKRLREGRDDYRGR